ncbi:MAG: type III-B CRISPR module RAMP protein Cmr6 [Desulfotignum sp.]|nr:type III-B CRISPR module RAMP protein Cmr6 [Desulfotignum sp.]
MSTTLPNFSRDSVDNFLRQKKNRTNPHLLFYRYLNGKQENDNSILKKEFLPKTDLSMLTALKNRHKAALAQLKDSSGHTVLSASFELVGRLVMGMGISSSFENGLLMDWIHGVPFINGEAVKGAARSFGWEQIKDQEDVSGKNEFSVIFGSLKKQETAGEDLSAGSVIFFNAYPESSTDLFDVDIITSHYGPYYTGNPTEAPGDWHSPNPVRFLTVKEGVFQFSVASRSQEHAEKAMDWLKTALMARGMGAKKRVGYGHFIPVKEHESETANTGNSLSSQNPLMSKIKDTDASRLPGMATELVKEIQEIPSPEEKVEAARLLKNRFPSKSRKKNRKKAWMQTLETIIGENP